MLLSRGQTVVRTTGTLEGSIKSGERVTVKRVLDENYLELEEHEGRYLRNQFEPVEDYVASKNRQVSDLEQVEAALRIINEWNITKPTGMMISIEAYPAQDGGSLFSTPSYDSNDVGDFVGHLLDYAGNSEKAAMLERAAQALRFGV